MASDFWKSSLIIFDCRANAGRPPLFTAVLSFHAGKHRCGLLASQLFPMTAGKGGDGALEGKSTTRKIFMPLIEKQ